MGDGVNRVSLAGHGWKARVTEFADSEVFDRLFREGMALVEEAAGYLDGEGRKESRALERSNALTYAAESMEVTTRLMQAASWLVVQRAVRERDMTVEEAGEEKFRLSSPSAPRHDHADELPASLLLLVKRSRALYERVWRLDETLYSEDEPTIENPVMSQMDRLRDAAESGAFDPLAIWRDN
ncbi:MAG: regulator of CtrA degradation rcdA [Hirschia sp.]|nr:regulator of CtrA degradation rcdA [Hirschia sp.]